jgi:hypothetical protein
MGLSPEIGPIRWIKRLVQNILETGAVLREARFWWRKHNRIASIGGFPENFSETVPARRVWLCLLQILRYTQHFLRRDL